MNYSDVLYGREIERLEVALYRATWPNGNEPDGETTVTITVLGAETEDGAGYILISDDNMCGGSPSEAGFTVYATLETAIAAAKAYAEAHDEEAETEQRYAIGTVNEWGIFQPDTIGNDPDLTTFELLSQAIWEIHECINASAAYEPITNAAVYDNHLDRIVWRQD